MIIETTSASQTENLGYRLGSLLQHEKQIVILLDGDLGAGKTTFTKGLAKSFGIKEIVNSPTFTILKTYQTAFGQDFYHLDLYRLTEAGQDFDLEEYIDDGIVVVEWPFQVKEFLPQAYLLVRIKQTGDEKRVFQIDCVNMPCPQGVETL